MRQVWEAFRDGNWRIRIGIVFIMTGFVVIALFKPQADLKNTLPGLLCLVVGGLTYEWGVYIQGKRKERQ